MSVQGLVQTTFALFRRVVSTAVVYIATASRVLSQSITLGALQFQHSLGPGQLVQDPPSSGGKTCTHTVTNLL